MPALSASVWSMISASDSTLISEMWQTLKHWCQHRLIVSRYCTTILQQDTKSTRHNPELSIREQELQTKVHHILKTFSLFIAICFFNNWPAAGDLAVYSELQSLITGLSSETCLQRMRKLYVVKGSASSNKKLVSKVSSTYKNHTNMHTKSTIKHASPPI